MSSLSIEKPYSSLGTSASGAMKSHSSHRSTLSVVRVFSNLSGTINNESTYNQNLFNLLERTTSGLPLVLKTVNSAEVNRSALNELRKLSGLTWEQLAKLFNVSRRSLHFWASGQPLSRSKEENLNRLLATIRYINRGNASANRNLLLSPSQNGRLLLDLLAAGQYEEVKQILGRGIVPPKARLATLSKEADASRMPPPPDELVDAFQEPVHHEIHRSRPARVTRSRRHGGGQ